MQVQTEGIIILRLYLCKNDWKTEEELLPQARVNWKERGEYTWLSWVLLLPN